MAFTYDPTVARGQVRLLSQDFDPSNPIYQDQEVDAFLNLNGGDVRLAAAQALEVLATNEVYVQKRIRSLDLQTDGSVVAVELRKSAAELRRQVHEGDDGAAAGMFDWAEQVLDDFTERERLAKQWQREGL